MRFLKLFFVLLFVFSCSKNENVEQFESALGKENSNTLTYLVEDFENNFLKRQYPDLNTKTAYKQFLIDIIDEKQDGWQEFSKESREFFRKSELRLALYCINDSVWIEKNPDSISLPIHDDYVALKTLQKCLLYNGSIDYHINERPFLFRSQHQVDSLIVIEKNTLDYNSMGSYYNALYQIPNKSQFLQKFIDDKQSAGRMPYSMVSRRFLFNDVDFNDYFIKRLIITDIVY